MEGEGGIISDFPMEVMQFTGLKDKNGKEIYEGDIVTSKIFIPLVVKIPEIYHNTLELNTNGFEWEVIGNIYENPELLNNGVK